MELTNINVCEDLYKLITEIKGIEKEGASKSDVWFVRLKPGTTFRCKNIDVCVMKIYPSPGPYNNAYVRLSLQGLQYEGLVYKQIINPLIFNRICPYFITEFGRGVDCSFHNIIQMLTLQLGNKNATDNFKRNMQMMIMDKNNIPSICDATKIIDIDDLDFSKKTFSFMLLQKFSQTHTTFEDYLNKFTLDKKEELWLILFQICIALYSLELTQTIHNDLHANNIVIEYLDYPNDIVFLIENDDHFFSYKFNTNIKITIFDFDRSYSKQLKKNSFNNILTFCRNPYYVCNKFIKNRDIVQVFCYLVKSREDAILKQKLIDAITKDPNIMLDFFYNKAYCVSDFIPKGTYNLTDIIYNCAINAEIEITQDPSIVLKWKDKHLNTFFHINSNDFDENGKYNL